MSEVRKSKLDGWKTIADYLGKDISTATRWARKRGMPVHRVPGGKGATVYAYTDELDAWVRSLSGKETQESGEQVLPDSLKVPPSAPVPSPQSASYKRAQAFPQPAILSAGLALIFALIGFLVFASRRTSQAEQISFSGSKLVALDGRGELAWEYEFSQRVEKPAFEPAQKPRFVDLDGDGKQEVLVIVAFADEGIEDILREELYCFSCFGEVLWKYEPRLTLSFGDRQYERPWRITDMLVSPEDNSKTIWIAMVHHTWWPSFIAKLDVTGNPTVQFVNSGGIYALNYLRNDTGSYILAGGINNEYSAAMLAVLSEEQAPATSPQSSTSAYKCDSCPEGSVYRYILFPRSELNLLEGGPYNRVVNLRVFDNQIELWTTEVAPSAVLLFEFSTNLEFKAVSASDGYAELHRQFSRQGKIGHAVPDCPELVQPYVAKTWDARSGWEDVSVPWSVGQSR